MEGEEEKINCKGRKVAVFYDDGGHISRKDGFCTYDSADEIILDSKIILPKPRIVRIEVY